IDDDVLDALLAEEATEPEAVAPGFVAETTLASSGSPKRTLAARISPRSPSRSRAWMVRRRGFCPAPMGNASFQVFQPSSREKQSTGAVVVVESWSWVAVMG